MRSNRTGRRLAAALAGVALIAGVGTTGTALADEYRAALTGAAEVPPGDPDGAGTAGINISNTFNRICVDIEVSGIGPATAAHIHRGGPGVNGPPVVNLDPPDGEDQDEDDCDTIGEALAQEIQSNPGGFYVNVHNAEYPNGAIRGQIVPSAD